MSTLLSSWVVGISSLTGADARAVWLLDPSGWPSIGVLALGPSAIGKDGFQVCDLQQPFCP